MIPASAPLLNPVEPTVLLLFSLAELPDGAADDEEEVPLPGRSLLAVKTYPQVDTSVLAVISDESGSGNAQS